MLWYDLREASLLQRWMVTAFHCLSPGRSDPTAGIPVRPLDRWEVRLLFPEGPMHLRRDGLDPALARISSVSPRLASLLEAVPSLQAHLLAGIQKRG